MSILENSGNLLPPTVTEASVLNQNPPYVNDSLQQKVKENSLPKAVLIFNGLIIFLKIVTVIGTLFVCFSFFAKGGDNIWVAFLIAPFFGSVIFLGLGVVMLIVNMVYLFAKKMRN